MLTARGFWFFLTVFTSLAAAIILGATPLTLVSFTLLLWFLAQWFLFQLRIRMGLRRLSVRRTLRDSRGEVDSIWARHTVEVTLDIRYDGLLGLPYAILNDRLPELAQVHDGSLRRDGALTPAQPLVLTYRMACRAPGRLRFEGVKIQLADFQGFFAFASFVRDPREFLVLPDLGVERSQSTFVKRHNVLPLLGAHRHARPGVGTELLDLRDYLAGDPPKMIAWKVSARRDRLITKESESEVPIRCTLFLDVSNSVRVGPAGETALVRLVEIAAGLAQANTGARDLTGLCLFDDAGIRAAIAPGRGPKHLLKLIGVLTKAAGLIPETPHARLRELLPLGYGLLQDVYPELLDRDLNLFPAWLPLWSPQPYYAIPQPPLKAGPWWQAPWTWLRRRLRHSMLLPYHRRGSRFSLAYHREYRWRKQVAAVLAVRYRLGPGALALLLEDDELCASYLQRFLAEHQVSYPYPFYDDEGHYLFAAPAKTEVLARALLKAVAHGKDNELFVLCLDGLELTDQMASLLRAVCVARARRHQVVVVCPWPAAIAPPGSKLPSAAPPDSSDEVGLQRLLLRISTTRLHQAYERLRQTFGRLGVPVICAAQQDSTRWILHRMRRLRIQERGVR